MHRFQFPFKLSVLPLLCQRHVQVASNILHLNQSVRVDSTRNLHVTCYVNITSARPSKYFSKFTVYHVSRLTSFTSWFNQKVPNIVSHEGHLQYLLECHMLGNILTAMNS